MCGVIDESKKCCSSLFSKIRPNFIDPQTGNPDVTDAQQTGQRSAMWSKISK